MKSRSKPVQLEALEPRTLLSLAPAASAGLPPVTQAKLQHDARKLPTRPPKRTVQTLPIGSLGPVAASPVPPVAPHILNAAAKGRTHAISVSWLGVPGATGYVVERSTDGTAWSTVQTVSGPTNSYDDFGLAENTTYRYRVRALNAVGASNPSSVITATTAIFRLLDSTRYANEPADLGSGFQRIYLTNGYPVDASGQLSETATRAVARAAADAGQILVFDIESWANDIRVSPELEVRRSVALFERVFDWARSERPGIKLGVFGTWPVGATFYPQDDSQIQAMRAADDYLIEHIAPAVDYLFTAVYTAEPDPGDWLGEAQIDWDESRRFGKPIYAFVWPSFLFTPDEALVPTDYWKLILGTVRANADGIVLWGADLPWDPNAGWWKATQDFAAETPRLPAAPSALSLNPTGAILSWNDNANDESGYEIERSTDGVHFTIAGATGADATTWQDSHINSGQLYYYRVWAINAWGSAASSDVLSAVVARNARVINQAENFEQGSGIVSLGRGVGSLDADDTILYRQIDFGTGVNQFQDRIAVPAGAAGQRIELHLDSPTGPLIGTQTVMPTGGYGDFTVQSCTLTPTSGIHDLYLVVVPRAVGGLGSGAGNLDWFRFAFNAPPAPPTNLIVNSAGVDVELNWGDNAADESNFLIERSTDGVTFAPLTTVPANVTTFKDFGLLPGVKYRYRIRAVNASGLSEPSNVDQGVRGTRSAFSIIKAKDFDTQSNVSVIAGGTVGNIDNGDYVGFYGVDFGQGAAQVAARVGVPYDAATGRMDLHLDDPTGPVIGSLELRGTGSYFAFSVQFAPVSLPTGVHDLYLVFTGSSGIANLDWLVFTAAN